MKWQAVRENHASPSGVVYQLDDLEFYNPADAKRYLRQRGYRPAEADLELKMLREKLLKSYPTPRG